MYTDREKKVLLTHSIERMLNTALRLAAYVELKSKNQEMSELGSISKMDIEDLKPLICKVWAEAQERVRTGAD